MHDYEEQSEQDEQPEDEADFIWHDDSVAKVNYEAMGKRLALAGDLFRTPSPGSGLIQLHTNNKHAHVSRGSDLFPVIVDRMKVLVMRNGKIRSSRIAAADLNAMLKSERFLSQFIPVDRITATPRYLPDFSLTNPGINDGGVGQRILYSGGEPAISDDLEAINAFLSVMQWFFSEFSGTEIWGAAPVCRSKTEFLIDNWRRNESLGRLT